MRRTRSMVTARIPSSVSPRVTYRYVVVRKLLRSYLNRDLAAFQRASASVPALSEAPIDARCVAVTGTSAAWSRLSCPASVVVAPASVFGPAGGGGEFAAAGFGGAAAGAPRRDVSGGAGASSNALIALRFNVSLIANTARNSPACVTAS